MKGVGLNTGLARALQSTTASEGFRRSRCRKGRLSARAGGLTKLCAPPRSLRKLQKDLRPFLLDTKGAGKVEIVEIAKKRREFAVRFIGRVYRSTIVPFSNTALMRLVWCGRIRRSHRVTMASS